jgi:hypothetical protein
MMGERRVTQEALFYGFSLERHVPNDHLLRKIDRFDRLRLRGPNGAKDEFLLAATAQNLRKLAKLISHPAPIFAT